jgi:hypothetical protein
MVVKHKNVTRRWRSTTQRWPVVVVLRSTHLPVKSVANASRLTTPQRKSPPIRRALSVDQIN